MLLVPRVTMVILVPPDPRGSPVPRENLVPLESRVLLVLLERREREVVVASQVVVVPADLPESVVPLETVVSLVLMVLLVAREAQVSVVLPAHWDLREPPVRVDAQASLDCPDLRV